MTLIGYTMMCEQAGPKQLVRDVTLAELAGFDFAVISDHYFPWLEAQGPVPSSARCSMPREAPGGRASARSPCPTTGTGRPQCGGQWTSSAGSPAGGE